MPIPRSRSTWAPESISADEELRLPRARCDPPVLGTAPLVTDIVIAGN